MRWNCPQAYNVSQLKFTNELFCCDFVIVTWIQRLKSDMHAKSRLSANASSCSPRFLWLSKYENVQPCDGGKRLTSQWVISKLRKHTSKRVYEYIKALAHQQAVHLALRQQRCAIRCFFFKFTKRFVYVNVEVQADLWEIARFHSRFLIWLG